jgi:hypothetical protein
MDSDLKWFFGFMIAAAIAVGFAAGVSEYSANQAKKAAVIACYQTHGANCADILKAQ